MLKNAMLSRGSGYCSFSLFLGVNYSTYLSTDQLYLIYTINLSKTFLKQLKNPPRGHPLST